MQNTWLSPEHQQNWFPSPSAWQGILIGLCNEVGTGILFGHIKWTNRPFPWGDWPEINIFCHCLQTFLEPKEHVDANAEYHGAVQFNVKCPGIGNPSENVEIQAWNCSLHKALNSCFKNFEILSETFCYDIPKHGYVFRAIVALTQLAIKNGDHLWNVSYRL